MAYNYSWNDSPAPVTPSNISSLPASVVARPPIPPVRPSPSVIPDLAFDNLDGLGTQTQPQQQAQPQGSFSLLDLLHHLFSGGQQAQIPGAPQGMAGMLQTRGQNARGTDSLGNPLNRFG